MKTSRFSESKIIQALYEYENGNKAEVICRDLGITKNTLYNWKKKYTGLDGVQRSEP